MRHPAQQEKRVTCKGSVTFPTRLPGVAAAANRGAASGMPTVVKPAAASAAPFAATAAGLGARHPGDPACNPCGVALCNRYQRSDTITCSSISFFPTSYNTSVAPFAATAARRPPAWQPGQGLQQHNRCQSQGMLLDGPKEAAAAASVKSFAAPGSAPASQATGSATRACEY